MATDDEDDYLSDKFLLESAAVEVPKKPLTYAERRKQAKKESEIRNVQNRAKSRRARATEALEQGLSQNLFERAKEEEQESGAKNKAMSMMLRMGFKPGKSLGRGEDDAATSSKLDTPESATATPPAARSESPLSASLSEGAPTEALGSKGSERRHRTAPLAIDIWSGKKGVGLGKRAASPSTVKRASKVAKIEEEASHETFRSRTREAFEERRVLGQLSSVSRTLATLDEKAGVQFNILSLDPRDPETFPSEIMEALSPAFDDDDPDSATATVVASLPAGQQHKSESERLRKQMQLDALVPLETSPNGDSSGDGGLNDDGVAELLKKDTPLPLSLSEETINEAREFLQLDARDRLERILHYLREKYHYCFWCGTQYSDKSDLDGNCPGEDEEAHD